MESVMAQHQDSGLLHDELLLVAGSFFGLEGHVVLHRALMVTVGFDLETVELDLMDTELAGLLDHVEPAFDGLTGVTEDELDVHDVAGIKAGLDRFERLGATMVAAHLLKDLFIKGLDADGEA